VTEIKRIHKEGRPVLVGTTSVEKSELLSEMLAQEGIKHQVGVWGEGGFWCVSKWGEGSQADHTCVGGRRGVCVWFIGCRSVSCVEGAEGDFVRWLCELLEGGGGTRICYSWAFLPLP